MSYMGLLIIKQELLAGMNMVVLLLPTNIINLGGISNDTSTQTDNYIYNSSVKGFLYLDVIVHSMCNSEVV